MIKDLQQYRFYIGLFMFLLIPVIAIDTSSRSPRDYRLYDRMIIALTAPIQTAMNWLLEQATATVENYIYLWHAHRDNLALQEENRKLLNTIANLRETQQENIRLRKLLNFEDKFKFQTTVARVIAKDVTNEFRSIRISKGENSGIKRNMAVVTEEGIVGRILRTTEKTADIVTILDPMSEVDVIDERSRARGIVEGLTEEICQLKYTVRTDDIQTNDILVSSGLGGIFPKGVVVGTVSKVNKKPFGISQDVEVQPSVDFTKLEEVLVIRNGDYE